MTANPRRRAMLVAASWAAPTLIVVTAAPTVAASPVPGLVGLMQVGYRSSWLGASMTLTTDGAGLGLRVENSTIQPEGAMLTLYLSSAAVPASTSWGGSAAVWSLPTFQRTEGAFTVWIVRHRGTWSRAGTTWSTPTFTFTASATSGLSQVPVRVVRTVTVGGAAITTDSGVVTLRPTTGRRAPGPEPMASDGGGERTIEMVGRA